MAWPARAVLAATLLLVEGGLAVASQVILHPPRRGPGAAPGGDISRGRSCAPDFPEDVVEEMDGLDLRWPEERPQREEGCSRGRAAASARKSPVMWIHLHKAAGSTVCALAKENGEKVLHPSRNCNWYRHDDLTGHAPPCSKRVELFQQQNATWGAIERVVQDEDFCPGFSHAILLREPTELALSAIHYHRFAPDKVRRSLACVRVGDCNETTIHVPGAEPGGGRMNVFLWWYFDNFVVRTLGGPDARAAPPGQLQPRHVERAAEVLARMEATLLLEDIAGGGLARAFGWTRLPETVLHKKKHGRETHLSDEDIRAIRGLNEHDRALYGRARGRPLADRVQPVP